MSLKIELDLDLDDVVGDYLADANIDADLGICTYDCTPIEKIIISTIVSDVRNLFKGKIEEIMKDLVHRQMRVEVSAYAKSIVGELVGEMIDRDKIKESLKSKIRWHVQSNSREIMDAEIDEALTPLAGKIKNEVQSKVDRAIKEALNIPAI